jgi:hypothetical protein
MVSAWDCEPGTVDEREFTPWAEPGWASWNGMSPEREFCEFAGSLARMLQPRTILETGVGQGFTTRRLVEGSPNSGLICVESADDWLGRVDLSQIRAAAVKSETATEQDFAEARLTVLDSDPPHRFRELTMWRCHALPGSVLLVHDCGNGHPRGSLHVELREAVDRLSVPGRFLSNPRGGFLGVHP